MITRVVPNFKVHASYVISMAPDEIKLTRSVSARHLNFIQNNPLLARLYNPIDFLKELYRAAASRFAVQSAA